MKFQMELAHGWPAQAGHDEFSLRPPLALVPHPVFLPGLAGSGRLILPFNAFFDLPPAGQAGIGAVAGGISTTHIAPPSPADVGTAGR